MACCTVFKTGNCNIFSPKLHHCQTSAQFSEKRYRYLRVNNNHDPSRTTDDKPRQMSLRKVFVWGHRRNWMSGIKKNIRKRKSPETVAFCPSLIFLCSAVVCSVLFCSVWQLSTFSAVNNMVVREQKCVCIC